MPKTASTSIQVALSDNRALLKKHGWEYPEFTCPQHGYIFINHNDPLCRLFAPDHSFHVQRPIKNGIIDLDIQKKGLLDELDGYCQNATNLILSSETLLTPPPLKRIQGYLHSQGYEIEPVLYVRSPYSYRVSLYQSFLKFSQLSEARIIENLQRPLVRTAVQTFKDIFGDNVKIYPFNHLGRSGVDIVRHFFSNFLDDNECDFITVTRDNKSLTRQAISLLAYIEEKSPLYVDNVKSTTRDTGDIYPLHQVAGEKFRFVSEQLAFFREVVDQENKWLHDNMGGEFCDGNYMSEITAGPLVWGEESTRSLLNVFPRIHINIQYLVNAYLKDKAVFSSPVLKKRTLFSVRKELSLSQIRRLCFPAETKRGDLARKLYKSLQG